LWEAFSVAWLSIMDSLICKIGMIVHFSLSCNDVLVDCVGSIGTTIECDYNQWGNKTSGMRKRDFNTWWIIVNFLINTKKVLLKLATIECGDKKALSVADCLNFEGVICSGNGFCVDGSCNCVSGYEVCRFPLSHSWMSTHL
jgi:hypothetical protein